MTSATLTLTDFLERRIAEDEAVARAATRSPWWYDPTKVNSVDREESVFTGERGLGAITVCSTGPCDDLGSMADAAHIARHDPARVLAECEAKRRIVEDYTQALDDYKYAIGGADSGLRDAVRHLATVYSDHEDYDPAWA